MHYLVVTQYYWPEEFKINDLVKGLTQRGHKVTVLTGLPNYPKGSFFPGYSWSSIGEEFNNGVRICRVPLFLRGNSRGWRLVINYLSFVIMATIAAPFMCREKYDLIIGYAPSPITVALPAIFLRLIKKIPFMFWVQDLWPESLVATSRFIGPRIITLYLVRKMVDFIYCHCDRVLIQSPDFRYHIEKAGISSDKILLLPNWAEELYKPLTPSPDFALKMNIPSGFKIMFAGNIGAAQDFETIVEAAKKLHKIIDIQWVILGDGRYREIVEKEVAKHNLGNVFHLLGHQKVELMPMFFAHADILLATLKNSPIFEQTIPSKIQTYLACRKPIITGIGGIASSIIREAQAGLTVNAGDTQGLVEAIQKMYHLSQQERDAMGQRGYEYYMNNFERNTLIDRFEVWSKNLVEKKLCEY